jgi:hypothetical protein
MRSILTIMILLLSVGFESAFAATCPTLVDRVCAVTSARKLETFNNACEAARAHAYLLYHGACLPEFCPHICIVNGVYARGVFTGKSQFYDNLCWAEKNFARYIRDMPCQ